MSMKNTDSRYGTLSIALHWLTLILMVLTYTLIQLHDAFKRSAYGRALEDWHGVMGLTIGVLVLVRLVLFFTQPHPRITPTPDKWTMLGAKAAHIALYAFMVVMPLIGWAILSGEGHDILFWGLKLPPLIAANRDVADQLAELHEGIGNFGYFLIGAHAAAALFHHYIKRDDTLLRMLPKRGSK